MKEYLSIIILILVFSCKKDNTIGQEQEINESKIVNKEKAQNKAPNQEEVDDVVQEIAKLYNPKEIEIKGNRVGIHNERENYQVTLKNSNLLDSDILNIEKHAKKIALIYYDFLTQNVNPFNFKKIIIKIEHNNKKINSFEYTEKDIKNL
jgi:hypothetical protein